MKRAACYALYAILVPLVFASSSFGQSSATGTPPFGSFGGGPFDVINLANLNVHFTIPIRHKAGRGIPFTQGDLSYDSSVWMPLTSGGSQTWMPVTTTGSVGVYWGWQGLSNAGNQYISYSMTYMNNNCGPMGQQQYQEWIYSNFVYHDQTGAHSYNGGGSYYISPGGQNCPPNGPQPSGTQQISPLDGSGLTLNMSVGQGSASAYITTPQGATINPPVSSNPPAQQGSFWTIDSNGNEITATNGVYTDTLGQNALAVQGTEPSNTTLSYSAPSGGTATYTVSYKPYTVRTNFGCSGVTEYNQPNIYLVDKVTLPDTTYYQFMYEATAGFSGTVTGRLASVSLPTGGLISYQYPLTSGGNNGINCGDGSAPAGTASLTRTLSGGTWTYARTQVSGAHWQTLITDPSTNQNQTLIDFQKDSATSNPTLNFFETERQGFTGSATGTPLSTTIRCYNGVSISTPTSCPSSGVATPISRQTVFSYLPNPSSTSAETEKDIQYYQNLEGFPSEVDSYDYAKGAVGPLLNKVITSYSTVGSQVLPSSVTVQDSGSNTKAFTSYSYDQWTPTGTSGTPNHTGVASTRGNLTTVAMQVNSGTTLYRKITYYDTGMANTISDFGTSSSGGSNLTTYNFPDANSTCGNAFATSISEPLTLSRSYTWSCAGGVMKTATDENGATVTTDYTTDPYFWRPDYTQDQLNNKSTMNYHTNPTAAEGTLTFNSGNSVSDLRMTLDGFGRVILVQRAESPSLSEYDTSETDYNVLGQVTKSTIPFQSTAGVTSSSVPGTTTLYDALGRPTTITDGGNGTLSYVYSGNDVLQTLGPKPNANENTKQKQFEYDGLGRLKSVCEVTAGAGTWLGGSCGQFSGQTGYLTSYVYDTLGGLVGVSQNAQSSSKQNRTYTYDMLGRLTSEGNPESGATSYTYDSDSICGTSPGDLVKRVDAVGNVTCYGYDAMHRNTTISYPSGPYSGRTPTKYFVYDGATVNGQNMGYTKGRLAEAYTGSSSSKITDLGFTYSPRGEVTATWESTPHSSGYYQPTAGYWENGAIKNLWISQIPSLSYGVDAEGRMSAVSASAGQNPVTSTSYNVYSSPPQLTVTFGSGDSDVLTYDPNTYRMTQYKYNVNGQAEVGNLGWNANGTLGSLGITDPINPGDTQSCTYGHDDLSRIASANCGSVWGQTFAYDPFGNIAKTVTSTGVAWQPTYNLNNRYQSLPGFTPSYDANGNLLADSFHNYTWDAEGKVSTIDSTAFAFTYDALGRNVEQNRNGSYYQVVYSPLGTKLGVFTGQMLQQSFWPLPGGAQAEYLSWGLSHYRHPDWLGSVRLESSTTHAIDSAAAYAPFGEPYAQSGSYGELSFTGANKDTLWLDYDFLYREYDPKQGRWISPDPAGLSAVAPTNPQSWNRYAYVVNNPLAMIDPLGLDGCPSDTPGGDYVRGDVPCFFVESLPGCADNACAPDAPAMFDASLGIGDSAIVIGILVGGGQSAANTGNCQAPFICNQTPVVKAPPPPPKPPGDYGSYLICVGQGYLSGLGDSDTVLATIAVNAAPVVFAETGQPRKALIGLGAAALFDFSKALALRQQCTYDVYGRGAPVNNGPGGG